MFFEEDWGIYKYVLLVTFYKYIFVFLRNTEEPFWASAYYAKLWMGGGEIFGDDEMSVSKFRFLPQIFGGEIWICSLTFHHPQTFHHPPSIIAHSMQTLTMFFEEHWRTFSSVSQKIKRGKKNRHESWLPRKISNSYPTPFLQDKVFSILFCKRSNRKKKKNRQTLMSSGVADLWASEFLRL